VRTNIEIEDTYLHAVMDRYGLHTKTEAVEFALRYLAMRGAHAIAEIPEDTHPLGAA
jgi:Arc/MetJ family transcription regulator